MEQIVDDGANRINLINLINYKIKLNDASVNLIYVHKGPAGRISPEN